MAHRRDDSDEALLARTPADVEAFAEFYRRWERPVAAFFMRVVDRGEVAADLTAEVFAEALASAERFDPGRGQASAWLFGIARHLLARSRERGQVENRARIRLGLAPLAVDDELIARVEAAGDDATLRLLASHPDEQQLALRARVLDERAYDEIAAELQCSESVVRKRVSRGVIVNTSSSPSVPGQTLAAVQYGCDSGQIVHTRGRLAPVAHGTVAGMPWTVEADRARHGSVSIQAGRFLLDGRMYGFCRTALDLELVNPGQYGVVYGLIQQPYRPPLQLKGVPGHGTAAHPIQAQTYPVKVHRIRGAFLFVGALPKSACAYQSLAMTASQAQGQSALGISGIYTGSCAPGQLRRARHEQPRSPIPRVTPPGVLSREARAEYDAGRAELARDGCLACHQIGVQGNDGPGPPLTHIGQILNSRALRATLLTPVAPMPSYQSVPDRRLRALVFFLHHLR